MVAHFFVTRGVCRVSSGDLQLHQDAVESRLQEDLYPEWDLAMKRSRAEAYERSVSIIEAVFDNFGEWLYGTTLDED